MTKQTTKRVWMGAMALVLSAALGACADQPMAVEEAYEVQMNGGSSDEDCVMIGGVLYCDG